MWRGCARRSPLKAEQGVSRCDCWHVRRCGSWQPWVGSACASGAAAKVCVERGVQRVSRATGAPGDVHGARGGCTSDLRCLWMQCVIVIASCCKGR